MVQGETRRRGDNLMITPVSSLDIHSDSSNLRKLVRVRWLVGTLRFVRSFGYPAGCRVSQHGVPPLA